MDEAGFLMAVRCNLVVAALRVWGDAKSWRMPVVGILIVSRSPLVGYSGARQMLEPGRVKRSNGGFKAL